MKAIKKVQVTPLDYNFGKIIDSASTTDDKTKNTYSMKVIDEELETKSDTGHNHDDRYYTETESDAKYQLKDDFAVLTGTITLTDQVVGRANVDYPTGFNKDNCVVISQMANNLGSSGFSSGRVGRLNVHPSVAFGSTAIAIEVGFTEVTTGTFDYKVVLMKIGTEVSPSV